jgi:hypothetical protein
MERRRKEVAVDVRRLLQVGHTLDDVLAVLRRDGCTKIESARALVDGANMSLHAAKQKVHESPVWADAWDRDEHIFDDNGK